MGLSAGCPSGQAPLLILAAAALLVLGFLEATRSLPADPLYPTKLAAAQRMELATRGPARRTPGPGDPHRSGKRPQRHGPHRPGIHGHHDHSGLSPGQAYVHQPEHGRCDRRHARPRRRKTRGLRRRRLFRVLPRPEHRRALRPAGHATEAGDCELCRGILVRRQRPPLHLARHGAGSPQPRAFPLAGSGGYARRGRLHPRALRRRWHPRDAGRRRPLRPAGPGRAGRRDPAVGCSPPHGALRGGLRRQTVGVHQCRRQPARAGELPRRPTRFPPGSCLRASGPPVPAAASSSAWPQPGCP